MINTEMFDTVQRSLNLRIVLKKVFLIACTVYWQAAITMKINEDRQNLRNMFDGCFGLSIVSKFGFDSAIFCQPSATQKKPKKIRVVSGSMVLYLVWRSFSAFAIMIERHAMVLLIISCYEDPEGLSQSIRKISALTYYMILKSTARFAQTRIVRKNA